jgi:hypothetical protein
MFPGPAIDTLTGAAASGAIALDRPQTFTSPSGRAVYSTAPGALPLDDTFLDTRFALNASWTQPLARLYTVTGRCRPVGGRPIPLSQMLDVGNNSSKRDGSESKDVLDLLLGFTQVLNRTTVLRVNYSYSDSSGYRNDPFKLLSVVDPVTGDTLTRMPIGQGPDGVYVFESRPDTRTKQRAMAPRAATSGCGL